MASINNLKYQFVSEPDDALKCLICLGVAEEPWQHGECGKLYCEKCLEKHGREQPCVVCQGTQSLYFVDGKSGREIKALNVRCDNADKSCEWVGTVGTFQEHVDTCEFALVSCPKECKENNDQIKLFMRKDLDRHLEEDCPNRDHTCEHCGKKGTHVHISTVHDKACPMKVLPCPNLGCPETVQRQHLPRHVRSECEHGTVECRYARIGCKVELTRRDMAAHEEDTELHLQIALDAIHSLHVNSITLRHEEPVYFKITDYEQARLQNRTVQCPSFYTFPRGYHMAFRVYTNGYGSGKGTHLSVSVHILMGMHDEELKWPFVGTVRFALLNQLEDTEHRHWEMEVMPDYDAQAGGNALGRIKFVPHSELDYDPVKNTKYLKDDTLYFRMSVKVTGHKSWLE